MESVVVFCCCFNSFVLELKGREKQEKAGHRINKYGTGLYSLQDIGQKMRNDNYQLSCTALENVTVA